MINLAQLLERNQDTPELVLSVEIIYGSPDRYTVTGYRRAGELWQKFDYEDRIATSAPHFHAATTLAGWTQPQRPVRKTGLTFNYFLQRDAATPPDAGTYNLDSRASNDLDARKADAAQMAQFADDIGAEYERRGQHDAIWRHTPGKERQNV